MVTAEVAAAPPHSSERVTGSASAPPPLRQQEARRHRLKVMKRRATGLLVVMAALFAVVLKVGNGRGWWGYVQAAIEASLVGGLADWFAVTALFRHPAGIPIPHTAIIRERKDDFGRTLGDFVQQNFLTPEVIGERLRAARISTRAADWLCADENAKALAGYAADLVVGLADVVKDEDVHRVLGDAIATGINNVPIAPLAARAIRLMTADGRHQELLDAVLRGLEQALDANRDQLRERFGRESPWWLPGAVEDRIFDRLTEGAHTLLHQVNSDPNHEFRVQFDAWVVGFADRLEHSPELIQRGEDIKRDVLHHPELRTWTASLWTDIKRRLRTDAANPDSELRQRLANLIAQGGEALRNDPAMSASLDQMAESAARYVADHFHGEIAGLVSGTIARWDAAETSDKLELLLGPDLQFIRINGTVVGGLAGLAIHAIAVAVS